MHCSTLLRGYRNAQATASCSRNIAGHIILKGQLSTNATASPAFLKTLRTVTSQSSFRRPQPFRLYYRQLSTSAGPLYTKLHVEPRVSMFDSPTTIRVTGAKPCTPITLLLQTSDYRDIKFASCGHYISNPSGEVDVTSSASFGGSYKGRFPAGLQTTLKPVDVKHQYRRLQFQDIHVKPQKFILSVHEGHLSRQDCKSPLMDVYLERHFLGPGVKRLELTEAQGRIRGALYTPAGPGPHPAVIDMFGGALILSEIRSALLASHGIMSLVLPYFGHGDLQKHLDTMELDYFEEAVEFLLSQPTAIPDRCGVVAICQGGAYAVVMGTYLDKVKAVYLINSPSLVYASEMSYKGKKILDAKRLGSRHMHFDETGRAGLNPEIAKEWLSVDSKYTIPIEQSSADTFYSINVSEDDSFRADLASEVMKKRLDRAGMSGNYEHVIFKNAGHIVEPPFSVCVDQIYQNYWPDIDETHVGPDNAIHLYCGGTPQADSEAQVKTWNSMRNFFVNRVRNNSEWYQNYLKNTMS